MIINSDQMDEKDKKQSKGYHLWIIEYLFCLLLA